MLKAKKTIKGFSQLSKRGKIRWIVENFFKDPESVMRELMSFWHEDEGQQKILDGFSENTISNYYLPYGVAPNFVVNDKTYCVPMVTEESSVVAAASAAAKFWMSRGGFHTEILATQKIGQVHFLWEGDIQKLNTVLDELKEKLLDDSSDITANMIKRGGGVKNIELIDLTRKEPHYYQLKVSFETCDSMGANFINSVLEQFATTLKLFVIQHPVFSEREKELNVVMSILSNYTPDCIVRAWVECNVEDLGSFSDGMTAEAFANKFATAVRIAKIDPSRATTHNKGIMNGVDAVVLATANDFRAVEACAHAYAAKEGQYQSLSNCKIENGKFRFWIDLPISVGTVGGLTALHPIAKRSLELLENPDAKELMQIITATGLAQNFAAIRSLITTGIQKGHMKMHLRNILIHLQASEEEAIKATEYFEDKVISYKDVALFLEQIRSKENIVLS